MKKILVLLFLTFGAIAAQGQEIKWMTFDEAIKAQKKNPKPIFMDVYTDWCGPCKLLDKNTFSDKAVADFITKNYYAVKFNAEGNSEVNYKGKKYTNPTFDANRRGRNGIHEFTMFLQVQGYPSMFILDKKGDVQAPLVGYRTPEELLKDLKG